MHVAGRNNLQGSSAPQFRNWTNLTVLALFENLDLDFDLGILDNMSKLEFALVQVLTSASQYTMIFSDMFSILCVAGM
jgi:hypothetical protein